MAKYIDPKANTYNLIEFQSKYSTERACEQALFQLKWSDGFICPKCGFNHCTIVGGRRLPLYQCPVCRRQTTAVTGTIMENTKLSLVKWFLALYFAATNKDGISEMALTKYIGVTLKTAWALIHKIAVPWVNGKTFINSAVPLKWMRPSSAGRQRENGAGAVKTKQKLP